MKMHRKYKSNLFLRFRGVQIAAAGAVAGVQNAAPVVAGVVAGVQNAAPVVAGVVAELKTLAFVAWVLCCFFGQSCRCLSDENFVWFVVGVDSCWPFSCLSALNLVVVCVE